jgi:DNA-binding SARP family transcriptional activator
VVAAEAKVRFGVLGPLLVERAGTRVEPPRSARLRGLLAVLLLARGRPLTRGRLAGLVWADRADEVGRGAVQVALSRLRRWLADDLGIGSDALRSTPDGYRLAVDPEAVDLGRFDALLALAAKAPGAAERCALLGSAMDLVRGPVIADLADLPELDAGDTIVRSVEDTVRDACLGLGEAALTAGRPEAAVAVVEALADRSPLDETVHARLIELLAAADRPAEALGRFERLRARLAAELGVSPGAAVQEAHLAVLARDRDLVGPPAGTGAGERAGPPTPRLLPPDVADFTGRDEQVKLLEELVGDEQATAVTIAAIGGMAGVGKTALAVHWAHRAARRFPDGQLYVNLRGYAAGPALTPLQALAQLLRALGVEPGKVPVDLEEAAGLYRSLLTGRRVVVVLDNAREAAQVRPLLPSSPGCVVLVTSRDRLAGLVASHGARQLRLDVLTPQDAVVLLGRVVGGERVAAEPDAAARLAQTCGYLPLAVRIAAANLTSRPGQTIDAYLRRLRAGDPLAGLAVDGDPQAGVRATFDLSYQRLSREARRLFRQLGLAPGPDVTVAAAAALAGERPDRVGRLLDGLVGAHLVESRGAGRFALHDLLRLYARDHTGREDDPRGRDAAVRRLLDWQLHGADEGARLLYPQMLRLPLPPRPPEVPPVGLRDHAAAVAWLDAERANMVAAIQHAAEQGPRPVAWLLADTLRGSFWQRGDTVDWLAAIHAGLAAAVRDGDLKAQAALKHSLGNTHMVLAQYKLAIEQYAATVELAGEAGWEDGQAAGLGNLGVVYWETGDLARSSDHQAQALAHYRRTGRRGGEAITLCNLAIAEEALGRLADAAEHQAQALAIYRELGSRSGEALAMSNLGTVDHGMGRLDRALEHLTAALALNRDIGIRYLEAGALHDIAAVHLDAGRDRQALESAQAAVTLARQINYRRAEAFALNALGTVQLRLGRRRAAVDHHREALELAHENGIVAAEAEALLGLAAAHRDAGDHDLAVEHAERAGALAAAAGFAVLEGKAGTVLAGASLDHGRHDLAVEHAERALALHRRTGHRLGEARTLVILGDAVRRGGDAGTAATHYRAALALLTDVGSPEAAAVRALLGGADAT